MSFLPLAAAMQILHHFGLDHNKGLCRAVTFHRNSFRMTSGLCDLFAGQVDRGAIIPCFTHGTPLFAVEACYSMYGDDSEGTGFRVTEDTLLKMGNGVFKRINEAMFVDADVARHPVTRQWRAFRSRLR